VSNSAPVALVAPAKRNGRALPHSLEAEQAVLGGILIAGKGAMARVADLVQPEDCFHPAHEAILRAMVELDDSSRPITAISVGEQMRASGALKALRGVGGEGYFATLTSSVVTLEHLEYSAKLVRSTATVRRCMEVCQEFTAKGYGDEYGDAEDYVDQLEAAVLAQTQRQIQQDYVPLRRALGPAIAAIEKRHDQRSEGVTGVPSGFYELDAMTAGFHPGELIIIAARPSMGKTSLVMNAVLNAAIDHGVPGLVFSLEMSRDSLIERLLASEARIDSTQLRRGGLEQRDWINLTRAASRISEAPICIDDEGAPTLRDIRAKARRWRANSNEGGCLATASDPGHAVVVVDYLQLIRTEQRRGRMDNREREVAEQSRGLKALAKELRCSVIVLSQLNRGVESREKDKRPRLSDLRESGAIEQDADVIAFIYRDEVYNKATTDKGIAEVILGKQRSGPIGTVCLRFLKEYTRFQNLDDDAPNLFAPQEARNGR